jgi:hypothetical protein
VEDSELRAAFHAAYDPTIPPAPWIASSIGSGLAQRRARPQKSMPAALSVAWLASILALVLIAALVLVAVIGHLGQRPQPVPGNTGLVCAGASIPPYPGSPSASPAAVTPLAGPPSPAQQVCTSEQATTDPVTTVAAFYQGKLAAAGWNVTFAGSTPGFVITRWVPDAAVTNGPEPGYRPELTGLTGDDVAMAAARLDAGGSSIVDVTLTPRGRALLADLTRANVAACPTESVCAARHLTLWIGLTQADINRWEDPTFVATVSRPFDGGPAEPGPQLISDPVTLTPIPSGEFAIVAPQPLASYLADGLNQRILAAHYQIRFVRGSTSSTFGTIDLVTQGPATVIWTRVSE